MARGMPVKVQLKKQNVRSESDVVLLSVNVDTRINSLKKRGDVAE